MFRDVPRMDKRAAFFPAWTLTIGRMAADFHGVQVNCTACKVTRVLGAETLRALVRQKGADYSLIGRRCRCRLTPGCVGWNRFHYLGGVYRPLWREEDVLRWWT